MAEPVAQNAALPAAPASLATAAGTPAYGLYAGTVRDSRFSLLRDLPGPLQRRFIEKKWQYLLVTTPEALVSLAIVDAGYLSSGFCAVFDRGARKLLIDSSPVLPPLFSVVSEEAADGMKATLAGPFIRARIERSGGRVAVSAAWEHANLELALDTRHAPPPITAIAGTGSPGRFDFTQKTVLASAEGEVRAGNATFAVRGQLAALDYTHGLLPRETAWRWALGMAEGVAFNFSEGFLAGEGENVVWLDGEPRPAGAVEFEVGAEDAPWRIHGGQVDLTFIPEGARAQNVDLKLIRSRYVQPFGTFSGTLFGRTISAVPGVTEDHVARW